MKAKQTMIAWNCGGTAKSGPWPDRTGWSDSFTYSGGACDGWYHDKGADAEIVKDLIRLFCVMVIRANVDTKSAYEALYQIDEFRDNTPIDMPKPSDVPLDFSFLESSVTRRKQQ